VRPLGVGQDAGDRGVVTRQHAESEELDAGHHHETGGDEGVEVERQVVGEMQRAEQQHGRQQHAEAGEQRAGNEEEPARIVHEKELQMAESRFLIRKKR